jgi:threonyl-tRNA synthetase
MIHRVIFGSIERFLGILTENYAGAFPLWLAPVQAKVIPVASRHNDYARQVAGELEDRGIRTEVDDRNERVGYKIRSGEVERVPYLLVLGDQEIADNNVRVRRRGAGDQGASSLEDFAVRLRQEIREKK